MGMGIEPLKIKICPRCGDAISWIERRQRGERVYYYAVHTWNEGGRRRVRKCYLGPATYEYVTRLHSREGLVFKGLIDRERALEYLESIANMLELLLRDPEILLNSDDIARRLRRVAKKLLEIAEKLEGEKKG